MIKIKLNDLVGQVSNLKALQELKLPVKVSYKISKLINNQIDRELKNFDEARNKLVLEFGDKNEDGSVQVKDPEKIKEFGVKLQELLDVDVELDFEPLNIEDLGNVEIEASKIVNWLFV